MRTISSMLLLAAMLLCGAAGPAIQPSTQPHEETATERAYRRLHARQAIEAAAATRPANAPATKPENYPVNVAREMSAVFRAPDSGSTSAAAEDAMHSEQKELAKIADSHVGDAWEVSARLEDVVSGERYFAHAPRPIPGKALDVPEAIAIFHFQIPAAAGEIHATVEIEGAMKDFSSWRRGGFYSAHVWTKSISPSIESSVVGLNADGSVRISGIDHLASLDFTCVLHPIDAKR